MYRLKLVIAYDGGPFEGWQSQVRGNTVQDNLTKAISLLAGETVTVHGAGRTDAGVHAMAQVAHVDVKKRTPDEWLRAINGNLPETIRVIRATRVRPDFHARFSAAGKVYRYSIWNASYLHPLHLGRVWHVPGDLDTTKLKDAAASLVGRHDFAGFSANRGKPDEDTVRTVTGIRVRRSGELITLTFEGEGFLYKMVRLLTGSLVRVAQGRAEMDWLKSILAGKLKTSFAAPAAGLCLVRVKY